MSRRYFEQMLEELELANLSSQYRWYASLNPMCYALPDMQYDFRNVSRFNRQDLCSMNYFRQPYWMSQGFAFPNYDPFSLLRRNDKRGFYARDNNFPREKRANGEKRFYPNRKNENNNFRMDRNGKKMDFMPQYGRRYQNGWKGETAQHYQLSREESRNASRLSFRDASIDTCVEDILNDQHFQNLKQVFENRNVSTNCLNLNENMNQIDGTGANAGSSEALNYHKTSDFDWPDLNLKSTQNYPGDTQYHGPSGVTNSYASWYCPEEQQQIVDMLKEVDLRHERQLQRNILLSRGEQPNPDESASHSNSQSADVHQKSSLSSDEDEDSINIILYPESCPGILEVPSEDIESGYHEKSANDFFDEFQNIFTGSPEKKIINTLTKESLKNTSSPQRDSEDEKKVITEDDKNAVKTVLNFEIADDVSEKNFSECSNIVSSSPKEHCGKILSDQDISLHSNGETSDSKQFSDVNASNAPVMGLFKNTNICAESSKQPWSTSKTSTESTLGTIVADVPTKNSSDNKFSFRTTIPENILDKENKKYINGRNVSKNNKLYQSRTFLKTEKASLLQTPVRRDSKARIISQQCKSNATNSLEDNIDQDKAIRINNNASMKLFDSDNYVNSNQYTRENEKAPSYSEPLLSKSNGCIYKRISISEIFNSVNSSYETNFVRLSDKNHVTYLRTQHLEPSHLSPSEHLKQILGIGQKFNSANSVSSTDILHKNMKIQQPRLCGVEKATASTNPKLPNISQQNDTATSTKCSSSKILNEVKTIKVVGKEINKTQQGIRNETVEQNQKAKKNNFVDEYCNEKYNLKKENYLNNRHSQCPDCKRNFQYNNYSQNSKQDSYWKRNKYNSQYESRQFKKYDTKTTEEAKSKCCEKNLEQDVHLIETKHPQHTAEVNTKKNNLQENSKLRNQESVKYDKQKKCVKGIEIPEAADSDLFLKEEISQKDTHSLTAPTPEIPKAKKKFKKKKQKKKLSEENIDKRSEITSSNISDNKHSSRKRNNDLKDTSETYDQIRQLNHSNSKQNISFSKTNKSIGPKDTGNPKLSNADIKREPSQEITEKKNDAISQKKNTINRTKNSRDKLDTKTLSPGEVFENETENKRSVDERSIIKDESSKKNYFNGRTNQFQEKARSWRRKNNRGYQYPNTNNESKPEALKNNNEHFKATTEDDVKIISKNTELRSNKNQKAGKDSSEYNSTSHQKNKFDNDNQMDKKENTLIAYNYKERSKEKTSCVILNCSKISNNVESNKDNQFQDIAEEYNNDIVEYKTNRQVDCDKLRREDTVQSTRCRKAQSEYQTGRDISNITTSIRKPKNAFSTVKENSSNGATSFRAETSKVEATKSHHSQNIVDVSSNSDDRNYIPVDYFFLNMMSHCRCTTEFMLDQAGGTDPSARKRKLNSDSLKELINKKKTYSKDFLILFVDENCAYEVQDNGRFRLTTSSKSLIKKSNCSDRRDNFPRKCVLYTIDEVKRLFNYSANNYVDNMEILTKPYSVSNSFGKRNTECNGGNMLPDPLKNIVILVSPLVADKYLGIKRFSTPYPSSDVFISRQISDFLNHLHSSKSSEYLEKCLQFSLNTLNDGDALHRFLNLLLVLSVIRMKWNPDDIRELLRFVCHNNNIKHKYFRSKKDIFDVEINEILHWWNSLCRHIEDGKR